MKISFMTFACPQWDLPKVLTAARKYGYHGVEIRCDADHRHGVEVTADAAQRAAFRRQFDEAGVEPCCLATSLRFVNPQAVQDAPARIALAVDVGCPALRVFCGPLPDSLTIDQAIPRVADHLRQVADHAQAAGIEIWLETHDSIMLAQHAAAIVRQANHPALALNYDNMHPFRAGEPLQTTLKLITGLVRHTHFHDAVSSLNEVTIKPVGQGDLPIDQMFAGLIAMGFDGYLSGEWFKQQYGPTPDQSLERFMQDMTQLAHRHNITLG